MDTYTTYMMGDGRSSEPAKTGSLERVVSCFVCGAPNATHEIREMSPRCGKHLCDKCKTNEQEAAARWRYLSS